MVWVAGQAKNHLSKSGSRGIKWVLALLPSPHSHTHSNGAQKMIHGVCLACSLLCSPSSTNTTRAPHLLPWRAPKRKGRYPLRRNPYRALPIASQLELKPLPYPLDGLEPHMSRETVECHWGQHHRAHVESLNRMIAGTELDGMGLEDIILASYNKGDFLPPFDHAAQVWNHEFFWQSMKPCGGGYPSGALLDLIERDFGSSDGMLKEFKRAALTQFGSGWVWLVYKANKLDVGNAVNPCPSETDNKLVITKTPNAVNPLVWDYSLLLAIDVWEHAYYLDYENRRADYISNFMEKLVAWDVVSSRLEVGMARAAERMRERRREQDEEEMADSEAVEMYLDSNNDDSEAD